MLSVWWKDLSGNLCVIRKVYSFQCWIKNKKGKREKFRNTLSASPNTWVWFARTAVPSLFPKRNMRSREKQHIVCVQSLSLCPACFSAGVCVHSQCVAPEGERASVQLSGSDRDLTRPLSARTKPRRPRPPHCSHATGGGEPACACVCVLVRVHVSHVWPPWRRPEL